MIEMIVFSKETRIIPMLISILGACLSSTLRSGASLLLVDDGALQLSGDDTSGKRKESGKRKGGRTAFMAFAVDRRLSRATSLMSLIYYNI